MLRPTLSFGVLLSAAIAASTPLPAAAQTKGKTEAKAKGKTEAKAKVDTKKVAADLASGDSSRIAAALAELIAAGESAAAAAPAVEALLAKGSSTELTVKALEAAGALKQSSSSAKVAPYVRHRSESVRRAAAKALVKTKGPAAVSTLRHALRSRDAQVRGVAATGLGTLGAKEALPDLFKALAHSLSLIHISEPTRPY